MWSRSMGWGAMAAKHTVRSLDWAMDRKWPHRVARFAHWIVSDLSHAISRVKKAPFGLICSRPSQTTIVSRMLALRAWRTEWIHSDLPFLQPMRAAMHAVQSSATCPATPHSKTYPSAVSTPISKIPRPRNNGWAEQIYTLRSSSCNNSKESAWRARPRKTWPRTIWITSSDTELTILTDTTTENKENIIRLANYNQLDDRSSIYYIQIDNRGRKDIK